MALILLVGVLGGVWAYWEFLAHRMRADFVQSLRDGRVDGLPIDLRGKTWTDRELERVRVTTLDDSSGPQRSLQRYAHTGGGYTLSSLQYAYQAALTDEDTGICHLFGYWRAGPGGWRYVMIHPESIQKHLEIRRNRQSTLAE